MLTYDATLQLALDLVGVFVFALTGGLVAVKKRLDLFGVLVLAAAAALGGGVLRDLLIGDVPPVGLTDWRLLTAAVLAGLVTFVFHPGVERISQVVRVLDAAGPATFAIGGSLKGWARASARSARCSSAGSPRSVAGWCATCSPGRCPRSCAVKCMRCPPCSVPRPS